MKRKSIRKEGKADHEKYGATNLRGKTLDELDITTKNGKKLRK